MPYAPSADPTRTFFWEAYQTIWIHAANTMPFQERTRAYRDIMQMTGASWEQVNWKASRERVRAKKLALKVAAE